MKATDQPLFSIFIPSWNNLPFLKLCVESIEKNSTYSHEILIHVNDGSDGTLEWVKSRGFKHTHSENNVGVCWAMNGLRPLMTTEYVAYVNDDMYLLPGWDEELLKAIREQGSDRRWFMASTVIQPAPLGNSPVSVRVGDYGTTPETFREESLLAEYRSYAPADWRGAMMPPNVVHRDMWDLVGGYSVEFTPGMGSDPDFCAKLVLAGTEVFRGVGKSLCYHFMSKSVSRVVRNDGSLQFLRKYHLTIRAFKEQILHKEQPWDMPVGRDRCTLRLELLRSTLKRLFTFFRPNRTPSVYPD